MADERTEIGKLYQDQLYGTKVLTPLAVAIIDTAEFQRLSGLRQLGFAEVVFRGTRHKRFEHSVGAYFLCRTIMRRIVQNHERLRLEHPGKYLSDRFRQVAENSGLSSNITTHQSRWRGLMEVVSAAALLHDLGHVPFGHTLEDEFTGLYERHDSLAGPRLYQMLFNESSELAGVFSEQTSRWVDKIPNQELRKLIYVILSWKEEVDPPSGFASLLSRALQGDLRPDVQTSRLRQLKEWHESFLDEKLFHPFMRDVVGNTICADLLDYLPRDRANLGMEPRLHSRLQRYFVIRDGKLYDKEGLRLSVMVTRRRRGGQRRDVVTAVLDIMRERYELAERVFYHHKKAAASAMLAKLVELVADYGKDDRSQNDENPKPRDDEYIYPAPWEEGAARTIIPPHMVHLSDAALIDYLGHVELRSSRATKAHRDLQTMLYAGLRHRRRGVYRTLLVVDTDVVEASPHPIGYFAERLRGKRGAPSSKERKELEGTLAAAAHVPDGSVIVYCPSPAMQAKVVEARLEISEGRILPLSTQRESFAYQEELAVLERYYKELWRAYVFVSPEVFSKPQQCKAIVDGFCSSFSIPCATAYRKVRTHDFEIAEGVTIGRAFMAVQQFLVTLPIKTIPREVPEGLLGAAAEDAKFLSLAGSGDKAETERRLNALLEVWTLRAAIPRLTGNGQKRRSQVARIERYCEGVMAGEKPMLTSKRGHDEWDSFASYQDELLRDVLGPKD
jgi:HD superfamily phosphohydrolase